MKSDNQKKGNVFRNRNFRLVFLGALVSELGAILYSFAVSFYILEISGNSADVAGAIVKEGAELNVGGSFGIDDEDIYEEKAAKETSDEETVKKEEAAEK